MSKKYKEQWQITILDKVSRKLYDKQLYLLEDESKLENVVNDLKDGFESIGFDHDDLEFEIKFINFINKKDLK